MASIQHLVNSHAITTAQSIATVGKVTKLPDNCKGLTAECVFVDGGGGTDITVYIQTSLDSIGSSAWAIICRCFFIWIACPICALARVVS